ncbi:MAG: site-specific integrase [Chloroflexota bacterium]
MPFRWVGEYHRGDVRQRITGPNREQVRRRLAQLARGIEARASADPTRVTVAAWLERWLSDPRIRRKVSGRTAHDCRVIVDRHLVPALGDVALAALTQRHVVDTLADLRAAGLAVATLTKIRGVLGAALLDAQQHGLVTVVATRGARIQRPPGEDRPVWSIDIDDPTQRAIVRAAVGEGPAMGALVGLMVAIGPRVGEVRGLSWRDVDLRAHRVTIRRAISRERMDGRNVDVATRPKTSAGRRTVTIPTWVSELLATWRAASLSTDGLVWPNTSGGPLGYTVLDAAWRRVRRAAGIDADDAIADLRGRRLQLRQLRHVAISTMVRHGVSPAAIARIVGHADGGALLLTRYATSSTATVEAMDAIALFGLGEAPNLPPGRGRLIQPKARVGGTLFPRGFFPPGRQR